jgi:hypothetical protein
LKTINGSPIEILGDRNWTKMEKQVANTIS